MSHMLIDLNQVIISNLMMHLKQVSKTNTVNEDLVRHMSLNTIRSLVKQFKSKYSDIILCCDNRRYWRREFFPYYKANRKFDREASGLDWHTIFETINNLRNDLKEHFPYKVIDVEGAEADDCIAVLSKFFSEKNEPVLILSGDKDFVQLQKFPNVSQYSPVLKRFIQSDNPQVFIREHIIKGDRGDGIPNILSNDGCLALHERQKPINKKKLGEWVAKTPEEFWANNDTMLRGYKRNQTLIDFDYIPQNVSTQILLAYYDAKPASKQKMLDYMISKGLESLFEVADEF